MRIDEKREAANDAGEPQRDGELEVPLNVVALGRRAFLDLHDGGLDVRMLPELVGGREVREELERRNVGVAASSDPERLERWGIEESEQDIAASHIETTVKNEGAWRF